MHRRLVGNEPGLVSYRPLDEGWGSVVENLIDNAYQGTIHGNPIWETSTLLLVDATPSQSENESAPSLPSTSTLTQEFEIMIQISEVVNLSTGSKIKLKSWKGDYLHRPDSPQGVTSWSTGVGNEWTVEVLDTAKIKLKSWKGDYLHRPDSRHGVTSWSTGVGDEWTLEVVDTAKIKLKSWKGDYLHRLDSSQGVTTWRKGVGNEWILEVIVEQPSEPATTSPNVAPSPSTVSSQQLVPMANINELVNKPVFIENQETKRYLFCDGEPIKGQRGDEGGWLASSGFESPKVVGADANYYNRALWTIALGIDTQAVKSTNAELNVVEQPSQPTTTSPNVAPSTPVPKPADTLIAPAVISSTYQQTCTDISIQGNILSATCRKRDGSLNNTSIVLKGIENIDGELKVTDPNKPSSYQQTCTEIFIQGNVLSATCNRADGSPNKTSLVLDGIENIDGNLTYTGTTEQLGELGETATTSPNVAPSPSPVSPQQSIPLEQSETFREPASARANVAPTPPTVPAQQLVKSTPPLQSEPSEELNQPASARANVAPTPPTLPINPEQPSPSVTPVPAVAPPIPFVKLESRQTVLVLGKNHKEIFAGGGALLPYGHFTIEAWIYPATDAGKQVIFTEGGMLFYLEGGEIKFKSPLTSEVIASSGAGILSGSWYHVAVSWAGSYAGNTKLYINGVHNDNQKAIFPVLSFGNTYLGGQPNMPDSRFQGKLLEVRVWRHARSLADIEANRLYSLTGRELGLVRYWSVSQSVDSILHDKTRIQATGTLNGDTVWEEVETPLKLKLVAGRIC